MATSLEVVNVKCRAVLFHRSLHLSCQRWRQEGPVTARESPSLAAQLPWRCVSSMRCPYNHRSTAQGSVNYSRIWADTQQDAPIYLSVQRSKRIRHGQLCVSDWTFPKHHTVLQAPKDQSEGQSAQADEAKLSLGWRFDQAYRFERTCLQRNVWHLWQTQIYSDRLAVFDSVLPQNQEVWCSSEVPTRNHEPAADCHSARKRS